MIFIRYDLNDKSVVLSRPQLNKLYGTGRLRRKILRYFTDTAVIIIIPSSYMILLAGTFLSNWLHTGIGDISSVWDPWTLFGSEAVDLILITFTRFKCRALNPDCNPKVDIDSVVAKRCYRHCQRTGNTKQNFVWNPKWEGKWLFSPAQQ